MIKPIVFTDLDDTLFQTRHKLSKLKKYAGDLKAATVTDNICNISFMTNKQKQLSDWLLNFATVIPVTARDFEQTSRVLLSFKSWKIISNGGEIIQPNGEFCRDWEQYVSEQHKIYEKKIFEFKKDFETFLTALDEKKYIDINLFSIKFVKTRKGIPLYFTAKIKGFNDFKNYEIKNKYYCVLHHAANDAYSEFCKKLSITSEDEKKYILHINNNNIAFIPNSISKKEAVSFVKQKIDPDDNILALGMGDSISDLQFMQTCDFVCYPQKSQIAKGEI